MIYLIDQLHKNEMYGQINTPVFSVVVSFRKHNFILIIFHHSYFNGLFKWR